MERLKEYLNKTPWAMVLLLLWMILSQYFAVKLSAIPIILALLGSMFIPTLIPIFLILLLAPGVFALASWASLLFRKKILAAILSGVALLIGAGASAAVNMLFKGNA